MRRNPDELAKVLPLGGVLKAQKSLRERGRTDTEIASLIRQNSAIGITAAEIAKHYAPPEHHHRARRLTLAFTGKQ